MVSTLRILLTDSILTKGPDFIIVGTMKSGTSTLAHHLSNHLHIHLPPKEVHFFNDEKKLNKGLSYYDELLNKNRKKDSVLVGEKTPTYSYQDNIAQLIHESCPETKLIWIFRNPTKRSYSNYLHALKNGMELLSFEEALEKEKVRLEKNIFYGYKKRSIYHEQVSRFLEFFPKEQMFFMFFEELLAPYSEEHPLNDLFRFLEVDPEHFTYKDEHKNVTKLPRFPALMHHGYSKLGLHKFWFTRKVLRALNFAFQKPGAPKLNQHTAAELTQFFKPHNEKLASLIDKDVSVWSQ